MPLLSHGTNAASTNSVGGFVRRYIGASVG
jgi:hypothetical protein